VEQEIIGVVVESEYTMLTQDDLAALREAKRKLENPSLTAKISDLLGRPLETGLRMLPARWHKTIGSATEIALLKGLEFSVKTMGRPEPSRSRDWLHKALAVGTGAAGGAIGAARSAGRVAGLHLPDAPFHRRHRPQRGARHLAPGSQTGLS
jgi:hypothetical protein